MVPNLHIISLDCDTRNGFAKLSSPMGTLFWEPHKSQCPPPGVLGLDGGHERRAIVVLAAHTRRALACVKVMVAGVGSLWDFPGGEK